MRGRLSFFSFPHERNTDSRAISEILTIRIRN